MNTVNKTKNKEDIHLELRCQVTSYKDHFEQRPLRTKETTSYKRLGVTSNKDFLYEVVPEFFQRHAEESFHTCKDHFVQRPFRTKTQESNFLFEFLDWVWFFFQHMALIKKKTHKEYVYQNICIILQRLQIPLSEQIINIGWT